jgi:hypothetical protein
MLEEVKKISGDLRSELLRWNFENETLEIIFQGGQFNFLRMDTQSFDELICLIWKSDKSVSIKTDYLIKIFKI